MYWIVQREDPRPETYVPVFKRANVRKEDYRNHRFKVFRNKRNAVQYAFELVDKFSVRHIRLFHPEGHSEIVKR